MNVYQIATVWYFYPPDMGNAQDLWEGYTSDRQTFATLEAAAAAIRQDAADWWEYSGNSKTTDENVPLLNWDLQADHHSATIPGCEPVAEWFGIIHIVEVRE